MSPPLRTSGSVRFAEYVDHAPSSSYVPPAPVLKPYRPAQQETLTNSNIKGTMRATALAARQARNVRQKRSSGSSDPILKPTGHATTRKFHEKRNLRLHLNLDECKRPVASPLVFASGTEAVESVESVVSTEIVPQQIAISPLKDAFVAPCGSPAPTDDGSYNLNGLMPTSPGFIPQRRRASSATISIGALEGDEFQEVAKDGPAELAKYTKRIKKLGKGAGGTVFLSLYLPTLKLVAVKQVLVHKEEDRQMVKHELHALHDNLAPLNDDDTPKRSFWQEMQHHFSMIGKPQQTHNPYLVSFYGAYLTPAKSTISIVMEFMDMGSLQNVLDAQTAVSEAVLRHCAFCCMTALEHMHTRRMVHRDIKPANILLNRNGDFKIADFGLAGTLSKSDSFFSEFEGTIMYMAPERIQGKNYSYTSDLWSMGVVLFSLATGSYPFQVDDGFFGLEEAIVNDPLPPMPLVFSPACRDFVKALLRRDPETRLTSTHALAHPFLRHYGTSSACQLFPELWNKMPIASTIQPTDVPTICSLMVNYAAKYPDLISLDRLLHHRSMSQPSTPTATMFQLFKRHSNPSDSSVDDRHLQQLADDCGVTKHFLEQTLARANNLQSIGVDRA